MQDAVWHESKHTHIFQHTVTKKTLQKYTPTGHLMSDVNLIYRILSLMKHCKLIKCPFDSYFCQLGWNMLKPFQIYLTSTLKSAGDAQTSMMNMNTQESCQRQQRRALPQAAWLKEAVLEFWNCWLIKVYGSKFLRPKTWNLVPKRCSWTRPEVVLLPISLLQLRVLGWIWQTWRMWRPSRIVSLPKTMVSWSQVMHPENSRLDLVLA